MYRRYELAEKKHITFQEWLPTSHTRDHHKKYEIPKYNSSFNPHFLSLEKVPWTTFNTSSLENVKDFRRPDVIPLYAIYFHVSHEDNCSFFGLRPSTRSGASYVVAGVRSQLEVNSTAGIPQQPWLGLNHLANRGKNSALKNSHRCVRLNSVIFQTFFNVLSNFQAVLSRCTYKCNITRLIQRLTKRFG